MTFERRDGGATVTGADGGLKTRRPEAQPELQQPRGCQQYDVRRRRPAFITDSAAIQAPLAQLARAGRAGGGVEVVCRLSRAADERMPQGGRVVVVFCPRVAVASCIVRDVVPVRRRRRGLRRARRAGAERRGRGMRGPLARESESCLRPPMRASAGSAAPERGLQVVGPRGRDGGAASPVGEPGDGSGHGRGWVRGGAGGESGVERAEAVRAEDVDEVLKRAAQAAARRGWDGELHADAMRRNVIVARQSG